MNNLKKGVGIKQAISIEVFNVKGESVGVYDSIKRAAQRLRIGRNESSGKSCLLYALRGRGRTVFSRTLDERVIVVKTNF